MREFIRKETSKNIENYLPISLLSHLYKILIIDHNKSTNSKARLIPVQKTSVFQKGFGTVDHIQTQYKISLH